METSLSPEALVRLINGEFPQRQSARPKLAQGTPAPTSQSGDRASSGTERESADGATGHVDGLWPLGPMEIAQPSNPSLGRRLVSLLSLAAGLAAFVAMASMALYVLVYLLVPPADEKLAATTAPARNASPTDPAVTPAPGTAMVSATSLERAPELAATIAMPAPIAPREEPAPTVADAPGALTPAPAAAIPAPAAPREEPAPTVADAPGVPTPGTAPAAAIPGPAAPPKQAAPIVAVVPDAPRPDTAPTVSRPAPAAPPDALRSSAVEVSALLMRGDSLFGAGDVASARQFYERASNAGDAQAALKLGATYDPSFLALARLKAVRGDLAEATRWYRRARDLGNPEAEILLKSMHAN
jgi:hypothetical protein